MKLFTFFKVIGKSTLSRLLKYFKICYFKTLQNIFSKFFHETFDASNSNKQLCHWPSYNCKRILKLE